MSIGAASMCWTQVPDSEFDSTRASAVAEDLLIEIQKYIDQLEDVFEAALTFKYALEARPNENWKEHAYKEKDKLAAALDAIKYV